MNVQQKIVEKAGEVKRENIPFSLNEKEFYSFMNGYFDNIKKAAKCVNVLFIKNYPLIFFNNLFGKCFNL